MAGQHTSKASRTLPLLESATLALFFPVLPLLAILAVSGSISMGLYVAAGAFSMCQTMLTSHVSQRLGGTLFSRHLERL